MYTYGKVIERPQMLAVPLAALSHSGEKTYYQSYENGKAVRTEVQTGVSDGQWIEVTNRWRRLAAACSVQNASDQKSNEVPVELSSRLASKEVWLPFDGSENVILGDLSELIDGEPVEVAHDMGTASLEPKPLQTAMD